MTTAAYAKLKSEIKKELFEEMSHLIVRDTKDPEGGYRPEFVKRVLTRANKKNKHVRKYNPKTFMKLIA